MWTPLTFSALEECCTCNTWRKTYTRGYKSPQQPYPNPTLNLSSKQNNFSSTTMSSSWPTPSTCTSGLLTKAKMKLTRSFSGNTIAISIVGSKDSNMTSGCHNKCCMSLRPPITSITRYILGESISMTLEMCFGFIIRWKSSRRCLSMLCIIGNRLMCFWPVKIVWIW